MNKPGAQEYYNSVYQKMADWGIDFVKVDDLIPYPKEIVAIGKAIFSTGRPMIYSLSPGGSTNLKDIVYYQNAHLIRITDDIWDNIESIDRSFDAMKVWQGRGYPGFWPDLDMIPFGQLQLMKPTEYKSLTNVNEELAGNGFNRWSKFNKAQMRTFITQRALFASPLIVGGDLPTLDDYSLELLTNSDMLACNQNGHPATLISEKGSIEIWTTAISDVQIKGWIGIFNRSGKSKKINISKEKLGLVTFYSEKKNKMERIVPNKFLLKNIWDNIDFPLGNDEITVTVRSQDVIFIYYSEDIN
jgi:hypothetical protein